MRMHSLITFIGLSFLFFNQSFATNNVNVIAGHIEKSWKAQGDEFSVWTYSGSDPTKNIIDKATLNQNGVTIQNGPSVLKEGIHAGDKKITNVADGEISATSHEAINGSQLHSELAKLGNSRGGGY